MLQKYNGGRRRNVHLALFDGNVVDAAVDEQLEEGGSTRKEEAGGRGEGGGGGGGHFGLNTPFTIKNQN